MRRVADQYVTQALTACVFCRRQMSMGTEVVRLRIESETASWYRLGSTCMECYGALMEVAVALDTA